MEQPFYEASLRALPQGGGSDPDPDHSFSRPVEDGATRRRDEVDSRLARTFLPRYTKEIWLEVPIQSEEV